MKCDLLEWDTAFFGRRVARVEVENASDATELFSVVRELAADVVYVVVPRGLSALLRDELVRLNGICYDHKVVFRKELAAAVTSGDSDRDVQVVDVCSPGLERLALASGWCSRFRRDPLFLPFVEPLYLRWIAKACAAADEYVLVIAAEGRPLGMTTVTVHGEQGKIGLVAVDECARGRGLGRRLMAACDRLLVERHARFCEVVTQRENVAACRLYEASGYALSEESEIWHVWKTVP